MYTEASNLTGMNWSQATLERYREQLSDETAMLLLPAILILGVIMLVGAVGNSLVLVVYYREFQPSSTRTAVLTLAVLDLITCLVCVPGEILDLRYSYTYSSALLCKSHRLLTTAVLMSSGLTLVCVAEDRYRRICRSMRRQATARDASVRVALSCMLGAVLAIPAALVYGVARVPTPLEGVTGRECSTSEAFRKHPLRAAYTALLGAVFLVAFAAMLGAYGLIGRQVLRQGRAGELRRRDSVRGGFRRTTLCSGDSDAEHDTPRVFRRPTLCSGDSSTEQDLSVSTSDDKPADGDDMTGKAAEADGYSVIKSKPPTSPRSPTGLSRKPSFTDRIRKVSQVSRGLGNPLYHNHSRLARGNSHKESKNKNDDNIIMTSSSSNSRRTRKTTMMLFTITLLFVLNFLPHLSLKAWQAARGSQVSGLASPAWTVTYNVLVRSHFLNASIHWIVYGFCSPKFRRHCRALCARATLCARRRRRSSSSVNSAVV